MASSSTETRPRTPLFRSVRKVVDAVEDVMDDVVDRGEDLERDARKMVQNLVRDRDERGHKKHHDDDRGEKGRDEKSRDASPARDRE